MRSSAMRFTNRGLLTTAILAALTLHANARAQDAVAATPAIVAADAQAKAGAPDDDKDKNKDKKAKTLDHVVVTGSLIPQSQLQTASPVITITQQDIVAKGYKNVYEALRAQPVATGSVQDSQFQGGYTQAANTVSLFGLDPGFTLVLVNGHPLADYPIPYKGTGNFVDLATIPTTMVDRIDILSGGQSSLYGSSAIAGVINIVLKKHVDGTAVSLRTGGYTEGGGQNQRGTISGGWSQGSLDANFAVQFDRQDPIWGFQRSFADSLLDEPDGQGFPSRIFWRKDLFTGRYIAPPPGACDAGAGLFGGNEELDHLPGRGSYCGSLTAISYHTLTNKNRDANAYLDLVHHLDANNDLYAEIVYSYSRPTIGNAEQYWTFSNPLLSQSAAPGQNFFWDNTRGTLEYEHRLIAPEEMGGLAGDDMKVLTKQYNVNVGARGAFGNDWNYDAYYNRSQVSTSSSQLWPLNKPFITYYLGEQQGTDPFGYGFPAYTPNVERFYTPLTPVQFRAMSDYIKSDSVSWTQNVTGLVTNPELWRLPSGPVGFAAVVQYGDQAFNNPVDPRVQNGDFFGQAGTSGAGARRRSALGAELRVPVSRQLVADASARFDQYRTDLRTDQKPTYKLGLEYRPIDTLLLRATYATAFRAPDMEYLFAKDSEVEDFATDWYQCRADGTPIDQCPDAYGNTVFELNRGSNALKSVTSKSFGYGLVFSPSPRFNLKLDYQHIAIDNEIQPLRADQILQTEADCRLGMTAGGQPVDIHSPTCVDAIARVVRFPPDYPAIFDQNQIQYVRIGPVNIANESLDGIQSSIQYKFGLGAMGDLDLGASHYIELHHSMRNKPGDPQIDLLHHFNSTEFKSNATATATWTTGHWSTTLHAIYNGSSVTSDQSAVVGSYTTWNASLRYDLPRYRAWMQLTADNLFDRHPPADGGAGWPFYNVTNFNGFGRSVFVEFGMKLGGAQ